MAIDIIRLACPGCGAKLEIHPDMDRFACGYCGNEVIVERRGGTVALKAVTAAIEKVQRSTDRTANELTLARLQKELAAAQGKRDTRAKSEESNWGWGCALVPFLGLLGVLGLMLVSSEPGCAVIGLFSLAGAVAVTVALFRTKTNPSAEVAYAQIRNVEQQIHALKQQLGDEDGAETALLQDVRSLLTKGQKLDAIKLLMAEKGVGMEEAMSYLQSLHVQPETAPVLLSEPAPAVHSSGGEPPRPIVELPAEKPTVERRLI